MKKSFVILILIVLLAGCQKSNPHNGNAELIVKTIGETTTENFDTIGLTALQMLQKKIMKSN